MKFIFFLIFTIFNFALIEFFSFVGSKMNLFVINETPFIYGKKPNQILSNYWIEKDIWGAWHEKNFKVSHKKKCFDVIYETNEIGARDKSFKNLKAINNIILLGDSFAEGYGIDKKNTFEKIIEKNLNLELLNFATSKDFGLIQYILMYEHLAKKYQHDKILISFLVNNDFKDNDFLYYKKNKLDFLEGKVRHRPYFVQSGEKFKILLPSEKKTKYEDRVEFLKTYFWFSNVLRSIKYIIVSNNLKKNDQQLIKQSLDNNSITNSVYYYTPDHQQRAAVYFLEKFIRENKDKKIILFTIPLYGDYLHIKKKDIRHEIYWWKKFQEFQKNYNNFYFLDLYDYSSDGLKHLFFPNKCDGHWNIKGHRWAGEVLSKYLLDNF